MRWVTFHGEDGDRVGVVTGETIHALPPGAALIDLVALGPAGLREVGERAVLEPSTEVALTDVRLLPPIPRPPAIRDCLCFLDHMRNCQQVLGGTRVLKDAWYRIPAFYFANPGAVFGPYEAVQAAPGSAWQDFELEIAAVIGVGGADLTVDEAQQEIIGYTILNDWSARDLQALDNQLGIGQAKGKDSGITLGPYLVTPDELEPFLVDGQLRLEATALVNGEVVGSGSTGAMDWTFAEVISYASRGVRLSSGDVFGSGTVPTCTLVEHLDMSDLAGFRGWLKDGDEVTLRVRGLGETRQIIRHRAAPARLPARPNPDTSPAAPRVNHARALVPYTRGLHEVGAQVWAWTLPDGGYGWSNAGLVTGDGASLLFDTLFDLPLTREMLEAMEPITSRSPITDLVLSHSNGDHTHGNQLLDPSVRVIAATDTATEIDHDTALEMLVMAQTVDLDPGATAYGRDRFGQFDFSGINIRNADHTFDDTLSINVGGRPVTLLNLGPAHTRADTVVHVPDAGVLFAGDLLFIGCTPIAWSGPLGNWIAACDTMIGLDAPTVVPGHGPVTDPEGIRAVRDYLAHVTERADAAHHAGQSFQEAADRIDLGPYARWLDAERVVVNVYQRYRELETNTPELGMLELQSLMIGWHAKHAASR